MTFRSGSGRGTMLGLSMVIMGGLLFAAGVMVGRQLKIEESTDTKKKLDQLDDRERKSNYIDTDSLTFHEELNKPPKLRPIIQTPTPKPEFKPVIASQTDTPVNHAPTVTAPVPSPKTSETKAESIQIQVASFTESSKATLLKNRLLDLGFQQVEIVDAKVGTQMFFRVRLGPLQRTSADETLSMLRSQGLDGIIIAN